MVLVVKPFLNPTWRTRESAMKRNAARVRRLGTNLVRLSPLQLAFRNIESKFQNCFV